VCARASGAGSQTVRRFSGDVTVAVAIAGAGAGAGADVGAWDARTGLPLPAGCFHLCRGFVGAQHGLAELALPLHPAVGVLHEVHPYPLVSRILRNDAHVFAFHDVAQVFEVASGTSVDGHERARRVRPQGKCLPPARERTTAVVKAHGLVRLAAPPKTRRATELMSVQPCRLERAGSWRRPQGHGRAGHRGAEAKVGSVGCGLVRGRGREGGRGVQRVWQHGGFVALCRPVCS